MLKNMRSKAKFGSIFVLLTIAFSYQNCSQSSLDLGDSSSLSSKASCEGPSGEVVEDGEKLTGYYNATQVACGESCLEQVMTCDNGTLRDESNAAISGSLSAMTNQCDVTCDHRNVTGNTVTNMKAGRPYLVSVYGLIANKGTGNTTLQPVRIEACGTGTAIAQTESVSVNWPNGSAPQSHTFAVLAPSSGCLEGFIDGNGVDEAMNMTVSEQSEQGNTFSTNQASGLLSNSNYLVNVYGNTRNAGSGNTTLQAIGVEDCLGSSIIYSAAPTINWPDGHVPQSMGFVLPTPANGCFQGVTDDVARNISIQPVSGDSRSVQGYQVNNLRPGANYFVTVYGVTSSVTTVSNAVIAPVSVTNCNDQPLAATGSQLINWHDGQAPQSASLVIEAPGDGCIRGKTDGGNALMVTVVEVP